MIELTIQIISMASSRAFSSNPIGRLTLSPDCQQEEIITTKNSVEKKENHVRTSFDRLQRFQVVPVDKKHGQ